MAHSLSLDDLSIISGHQSEAHNATSENNEGYFCYYVITPIKDAARNITDSICTLCSTIWSFIIDACSPCCSNLLGSEKSSSESGSQESVIQDDNSEHMTETGEETPNTNSVKVASLASIPQAESDISRSGSRACNWRSRSCRRGFFISVI